MEFNLSRRKEEEIVLVVITFKAPECKLLFLSSYSNSEM